MHILRVILLIVEVISALLLIGVILLQKSRSEGMGLAFGASMGESLFGSRAGNVLTRITVILGVVFLLNTLGLAKLYSGTQGSRVSESLVESSVPPSAPSVPGGLGPESGAAVAPGMVELPATPAAPVSEEAVPVAPEVKSDEIPAATR
jgi:preprotein translocase subunit SecG